MRQLDGITNSMNRSSSKLQGIVKDGEPGVLQSMGLQSVRHDLATEQQWASLVAQWLKKKKKNLPAMQVAAGDMGSIPG